MRGAITVGALAGLIALERLVELVLLRIGSRPLGQFWAWLTGTINGLPQAELWTVLVGLFGLVGLRSLALRAGRPAVDRRTQFRS